MISSLVSISSCTDNGLGAILIVIKNSLSFIQIIAPITLLIMATVHFINLIRNPDDKKRIPKIKNSFIAAAVIFFIPLLIDVVMNIVGSKTKISDCWNNASISKKEPTYQDTSTTEKRTSIYTNPEEYQ